MRKHEPELFARIRKVMLPKDYLNYMLTGVHCTDVSDASGMLLFDVEHKCWSPEMLELCGLNASQMARVFESYETVGTLKPDVARSLDLPKTVKVCAGCRRQRRRGSGNRYRGRRTVQHLPGHLRHHLHLQRALRRRSPQRAPRLCPRRRALSSHGCMLSAASCNKWWMDDILGTKDYAAEQSPITDERLGCNHVFSCPISWESALPTTIPPPGAPSSA